MTDGFELIDGDTIEPGGASLKIEEFTAILAAAAKQNPYRKRGPSPAAAALKR